MHENKLSLKVKFKNNVSPTQLYQIYLPNITYIR